MPATVQTDFNKHIKAAQGYLALGMPLEADAELDEIDPELRDYSGVLCYRLKVYRALEKWDLMQTVARTLTRREPGVPDWWVALANATRRLGSVENARSILLKVVEIQSNVAILHYNLACYECQLGNVEEAKSRLKQAFELEPRYRVKAPEDEDLEALWDRPPS